MFAGRITACVLSLTIPVATVVAQDHPPRPAYDGSSAPDVTQQVRVDGQCRILSDPKPPFSAHKPAPFRDVSICHIENVLASVHHEGQTSGNQLLRSTVRVSEQTYVLQNITGDHVVFVLEVPVPDGWQIDSDPQPNRFSGSTAIFPLHAQAGEIVTVHVGMRHTTSLRPKKISAPAPQD
jgi:hypothetical protein